MYCTEICDRGCDYVQIVKIYVRTPWQGGKCGNEVTTEHIIWCDYVVTQSGYYIKILEFCLCRAAKHRGCKKDSRD